MQSERVTVVVVPVTPQVRHADGSVTTTSKGLDGMRGPTRQRPSAELLVGKL
jgi:hypothetical protein